MDFFFFVDFWILCPPDGKRNETKTFITPPPVYGDGVLFSGDFFLSLFLCLFICFFVSKITRKRLDRFA